MGKHVNADTTGDENEAAASADDAGADNAGDGSHGIARHSAEAADPLEVVHPRTGDSPA
jgi:hypothetical protein